VPGVGEGRPQTEGLWQATLVGTQVVTTLSEKPYRRHPYAVYNDAQGCVGYVFRIHLPLQSPPERLQLPGLCRI